MKNLFRLSSACLLFAAGVALNFAPAAQAQTLPDLRGRNLSITGNLTATGTILFGFVNISSLLPAGGAVIPVDHPAQLTIAATGPDDDSALTASVAIGTFDTVVNGVFYAGWKNPSLPLTGSFNRATGAFALTGTLAGTSVIDFGVHDTGSAGGGIKRALIQFNNLGLILSGTGKLDSAGVFRITNPNYNAFTFTSNGTTPALSLQDPALRTFQTAGDYVIASAAFRLTNWTAQAIVSGLVSLEGVTDLTKISPNAPLNPLTFSFRNVGSTTPIVATTFALTTAAGSAQGGYYLTGIPFGTYDLTIKGDKNLRVIQSGIVVAGNATVPTVELPAGDANNDNSVDSSDFTALIGAFSSDSTLSGSGYDPTADFNYDGFVDSSDFTLLIGQFNNVGAK